MEKKIKLLNRIKSYFSRPKGFKRLDMVEKATIINLNEMSMLNNHMIAVARLQFIKPDTLYREANNIKANTEYMNQLIEAKARS